MPQQLRTCIDCPKFEEVHMIETERLLLKHYSGADKEIRDMLKNWISDPAVQEEYGEPVYISFISVKELMKKVSVRTISLGCLGKEKRRMHRADCFL